MARLILHVGRSKTGSTYLQEFLALNRARLATAGVVVPDLFATANHAELALAFTSTPGTLARAQAIKTDADRVRLQRRLDRKLRSAVRPGATWVLTSEHLSSRLRDPSEITALHHLLSKHFDEIHVLAYLRRPDYLVPSLYAEAVKAGARRRLNQRFVARRVRSLDHAAFLDQWAEVFGQVVARPYLESFKRTPDALVSDLLTQVSTLAGLSVRAANDWTWPERGANQSLSAEGTEFLRLVNPYVPEGALTQEQRRSLIEEIRTRCPGLPVALTPPAADVLRADRLLSGRLDRSEPEDPLWTAWYEEPPAPLRRQPRLTPQRAVDLMAELSAPNGPIVWGGKHLPNWVPEGAVDTLRTAAVRVTRR